MDQEQNEENTKEEEPFGLGCARDMFAEIDEVYKMIDNLKIIIHAERSKSERAYEKFSFILGQYIEQPHLLDKNLDDLLSKFIEIVRNPESSIELKHLTFKYLCVVVNVRGYKVIVRHLPHEVADFEPVLQLLEAQDPTDTENWTTRYILLLWLSIIVMIPFHMSRLDGFDEEKCSQKTVMSRVLDIIQKYAVVSDKCRDAAAYLSSRFVVRYDVKEEHLVKFFDWAMELSLSEDSNVFVKYGTLACVAMILKHGKREDLLPHARKLLSWIVNSEFKDNTGTSVQKLVYKIVQRIGLTFLPPKMAAWRYKRGNRSLASNLNAGDYRPLESHGNKELLEQSEDIDVPDEVEEVIDQLIQGLGSADCVVRWSAAKGIGRVTGRLPKELADEVVGSVLELFNPREGDGAWHGGCLALAELGRRGLLLPQRLPEVVPVVLKALVYDEPRGYSSVGSHIRDAACYVCWSFARAYETEVLKPFVKSIASILLVVTCFDREINCRRAASAAFQENVGRQGTFPHGIDILTTADFFAVSVRHNSYLNISVYIAQFEEYTLPLIDHLLERKVDHWDASIRELTAKALHNLTPLAPEYMVLQVLPALFEKAQSIDLNSRHGAILCIGEVIHAISLVQPNQPIISILNTTLIENCKNLIPDFRQKLFFRGLGGELMRQACSNFIEKCSLAHMPFHRQPITDEWLTLINESLSYDVVNIRISAIKALPFLLQEYYSSPELETKQIEIINIYLHELKSTASQVTRMGHALALGSLPKFMLLPNLQIIIDGLIESTDITPISVRWAESRKDAVKALTTICNVSKDNVGKEFPLEYVKKVYDTFLEGLKDYTQDKRGDIGGWMREASLIGLQTLALISTEMSPSVLESNLIIQILSGVAQQAVEKIDRTRAVAGRVFYSFIYCEPPIPNIPNFIELSKIFPKDECDDLIWNSAAATFPKFVQLIQFPPYSYNVLLGMICSIGGLTETLVRYSSLSFITYLKNEEKTKGVKEIARICDIIYQIFLDHQKIDRITIAMFRFLDKLLGSGCLDHVIHDPNSEFPKKILKLIQLEIAGCKDIYKLVDGINVLCQFIQINGDISRTALVQLSILLCHRQTYIRRSTSTRLFESLLVYGDRSVIKQENLDDVMQLLSNTNWEDIVDKIKPFRNELCNLMGIKVPVTRPKTQATNC